MGHTADAGLGPFAFRCRHGGVAPDFVARRALLFGRRGDHRAALLKLRQLLAGLVQRHGGIVHESIDLVELRGNIFGHARRLSGQRLDLLRDNGKPAPGFTSPGGLDRRVERQQIGLTRHIRYRVDNLPDTAGPLHEQRHRRFALSRGLTDLGDMRQIGLNLRAHFGHGLVKLFGRHGDMLRGIRCCAGPVACCAGIVARGSGDRGERRGGPRQLGDGGSQIVAGFHDRAVELVRQGEQMHAPFLGDIFLRRGTFMRFVQLSRILAVPQQGFGQAGFVEFFVLEMQLHDVLRLFDHGFGKIPGQHHEHYRGYERKVVPDGKVDPKKNIERQGKGKERDRQAQIDQRSQKYHRGKYGGEKLDDRRIVCLERCVERRAPGEP